jgi:flagellar hook-associated protein 3 FlgL
MRVTEAMIYQQTIDRANVALVRVSKAQSELSSGLRVQSPADDPQAAGLLVRHKFDQTQITAIQNGAQSAANELNTAGSALGRCEHRARPGAGAGHPTWQRHLQRG